jgi:hypothetical protein
VDGYGVGDGSGVVGVDEAGVGEGDDALLLARPLGRTVGVAEWVLPAGLDDRCVGLLDVFGDVVLPLATDSGTGRTSR